MHLNTPEFPDVPTFPEPPPPPTAPGHRPSLREPTASPPGPAPPSRRPPAQDPLPSPRETAASSQDVLPRPRGRSSIQRPLLPPSERGEAPSSIQETAPRGVRRCVRAGGAASSQRLPRSRGVQKAAPRETRRCLRAGGRYFQPRECCLAREPLSLFGRPVRGRGAVAFVWEGTASDQEGAVSPEGPLPRLGGPLRVSCRCLRPEDRCHRSRGAARPPRPLPPSEGGSPETMPLPPARGCRSRPLLGSGGRSVRGSPLSSHGGRCFQQPRECWPREGPLLRLGGGSARELPLPSGGRRCSQPEVAPLGRRVLGSGGCWPRVAVAFARAGAATSQGQRCLARELLLSAGQSAEEAPLPSSERALPPVRRCCVARGAASPFGRTLRARAAVAFVQRAPSPVKGVQPAPEAASSVQAAPREGRGCAHAAGRCLQPRGCR
jgi:hypothetical protein